jgi:hypothetical protein
MKLLSRVATDRVSLEEPERLRMVVVLQGANRQQIVREESRRRGCEGTTL